MSTTIRVGVQNMKHNGWGRAGGDAAPTFDRLPFLTERLDPLELDLLILNECGTRRSDVAPNLWKERIERLAADLGMRVALITNSQNNTPSALVYRHEVMGEPVWWDSSQDTMFKHGAGAAAFEMGLPLPLTVGAIHITPFSRFQAAVEINTLICRSYRKGSIGLFGGDFNFCLYGSDPHWDRALPHNIMNRALINGGDRSILADVDLYLPDGTLNPEVTLEPDFTIANEIAAGDCHDVAWELYQRSRAAGGPDESLLQPTGGHARVDGIAVTGALRPALTRYGVADTSADASDHKAVWCELDLARYNPERIFDYK